MASKKVSLIARKAEKVKGTGVKEETISDIYFPDTPELIEVATNFLDQIMAEDLKGIPDNLSFLRKDLRDKMIQILEKKFGCGVLSPREPNYGGVAHR